MEKNRGDSQAAPVYVLSADLFFRAKIEATANAVGVPIVLARTGAELEGMLEEIEARGGRAGAAGGPVVLFDLSDPVADPPVAIRALKSRARAATVVAFGSHRDREALKSARDAGADQVLARSTFVERLPDLLREVLR